MSEALSWMPHEEGDLALLGYLEGEALRQRVQELDALGCHRILGPMEGTTWQSYRLVTWSDGSIPFALEAERLFQDPAPWRALGFREADGYFSSRLSLAADAQAERAQLRFEQKGLQIRPLDLSRFTEELDALHELSLIAFAHNLWYQPISREAFHALYLPFADQLLPDCVRLAEADGQLQGFVFSQPDPRRGELIIKTVAIRPERRWAGLGRVLCNCAAAEGRALGMDHGIHAFMHDANVSANLARDAEVIRRYHLLIRERDRV